MTITSAAIEANGWVLAVRGIWGATPGAWDYSAEDRTEGAFRSGGVDQFPLTPNARPKLVLSLTSPGFDRTLALADKATANPARPRQLVATKALRRAWPSIAQLDEFDHGDGTRTVRLALSDRVYANDIIASLTVAPGWKAGHAGGTVANVANNSTRTCPLVMSRWVSPNALLAVGNTHVVECLVASHYPEHYGIELHQACAAVRFDVTDGTTAKSVWATSASTSTRADGLRCWRATLDLTGLNPGALTVRRTVFPWIGAARTSLAGEGAAFHVPTHLSTAPTPHDAPLHVCYDPAGTRYARKFVFVDTTSTVTTVGGAGAVTLHDSIDAARAAPVTAKPANMNVALRAFRNLARTLPAANGFPGGATSADFYEIVLTAGQVHVLTGEAVATTGAASMPSEGRIVVRGDPADPDPRANTIWRTRAGAGGDLRCLRWHIRDMTLELGDEPFLAGSTTNQHNYVGENAAVRAKPGATTTTSGIFGNVRAGQIFDVAISGVVNQDMGASLRRNVTQSRGSNASVSVNVTIGAEAGTPRAGNALVTLGSASSFDRMVWGCQVYGWNDAVIGFNNQGPFGSPVVLERFALVNTVIEGGSSAFLQLGENNSNSMRSSLMEGNTVVGNRFNMHADPLDPITNAGAVVTVGLIAHGLTTGQTVDMVGFTPAGYNGTGLAVTVIDANRFSYTTAAGTNPGTIGRPATFPTNGVFGTVTLPGGVQRPVTAEVVRHDDLAFRNNIMDDHGTKHDVFAGDPLAVGGWPILYGVGWRGNVLSNRDGNAASAASFQFAFYGLGSFTDTSYSTGNVTDGTDWWRFVNDQCGKRTGGTRYGDYRLTPDSVNGSVLARGAGPANIGITLDGQARSSMFSTGAFGSFPPVVFISLAADRSRHPHLAEAAGIASRGAIAPARSVHIVVGDAAGVASQAVLRGSRSVHESRAEAGGLQPIAPQPAGQGFGGRILIVEADVRTLSSGAD